jgi:vancomycin resistance protein VanJ
LQPDAREPGLAIRSDVLGEANAVQTQRWRWTSTAVAVCIWLYVAALLAVWLLLWFAGDRWWFATVILFGPRWVCALPLVVLAPAAGLVQRRLLWALAGAAIMVVGPIMGFCIPWARLKTADGPTLRVLTCNLKGRCTDNAALDKLIAEAKPDIIALQGCWMELRIRWPEGWHVCQVADYVLASHYPIVHPGTDHSWQFPGGWSRMDIVRYVVQTSSRDIDVCSVHLLSPHLGLEAVLDRKTLLRPSDGPILDAEIDQRRDESEEIQGLIRNLASPILAGDFNLPVDSTIYRQYWAGFRNGYSDAGWGFGYTEWPQIRGRLFGIRIDHVLTGPGWRCHRCWVGPDVGSDHLPLLADLSFTPAE